MAPPDGPARSPAGWYDDPGGGRQQRYWDGTQWTEQYAGSASPAAGPPASRVDLVRFTTTIGGEFLATFDGVILDVFGADVPGQTESGRFHRGLMTITIDEPDRKGSRKVSVYAGPGPGRKVPNRYFVIAERDQHVVAFFERIRAALPSA